MIALDHDTGLLRGLVTDTQDGVGQIARALEEAATTFRVGYVQELRRRLAPGAGRGATDAIAVGSAGDTPGAIIVVQRGRGDLYRAVERGVAGPGLAVIWDRRRNERRRGARRPDRARAPPSRAPRLAFRDVDAARVSAGVDQRRPESARAARPAPRERRARHAPLTRPGRPARARPHNRQPRGLPVGQSAASAPSPAIAAAVHHVAA